MIDFPPAKINLGLRVIRRRHDGYHDLLTVFYPIPLCDSLEILPAREFKFHSYGIPIPGRSEENLVVKAWKMLHELKEIPAVEIHLLKNIPMGAGLGGGSSDAAFTLRILNDIFKLNLSSQELTALALQLGSDCPFFINPYPSAASGRGEELQKVEFSLRGKFLVLVKPDLHISTREAYLNIQPTLQPHPLEILKMPQNTWRGELINDFEGWAIQTWPELGQIKETLYAAGAFYASMTGSGSAFYGLFEQEPTLPVHLKNHYYKIMQLTS